MRCLPALALTLALAAPPVLAAPPQVSPEADVAKALAGRVAGPPQSCINLWRNVHVTIAGHALIYRDGTRWYVNRPDSGTCGPLRPDRTIIVSRTPMSRLCAGDIVQLAEPMVGEVGACTLGPFTPYTRPK